MFKPYQVCLSDVESTINTGRYSTLGTVDEHYEAECDKLNGILCAPRFL